MATAAQVKALLESHARGDDKHFYAVAMQVAAHAAKQGHGNLAQDIRMLVDNAKVRQKTAQRPDPYGPLVPLDRELTELLSISGEDYRLGDLVLPAEIRGRLARILKESRQREKLQEHGLTPRRKILLMGPPGSGKTFTAAAIAGELRLPLMTVVLEGLITRFLGETAAKLRVIFEAMTRSRAVYLFDEFDAIGGSRGFGNEVGEIRRVLSSFLQLLEQDRSPSLIIAATNNPKLLDSALFRRFDDIIEYGLPDEGLRLRLLQNRLAPFDTHALPWEEAVQASDGLSHAEIVLACNDAAKEMILEDQDAIQASVLMKALVERHAIRTE